MRAGRTTLAPTADLSDGLFRLLVERAPAAAAPHEGLPSGQNARLRGGIEKETEGVTLVATCHRPQQFPLHPYTFGIAKRKSFLIDSKGKIAKVYESVSPAKHAGEVAEALAGVD